MKRSNKKGFTIVELVIVIAVIAILAAVLIPTFANLIKKANLSSDEVAVRNMNTVLQANAVDGKPANLYEVRQLLSENGFNADKNMIPATKGYSFLWNSEKNVMMLVDENDEVVYPEDCKGTALEKTSMIDISFPAAKVTDTGAKSVTTANGEIPLDCSFSFEGESPEEAAKSEYANWRADWVVSFDKDINVSDKGQTYLAGQYARHDGNWVQIDPAELRMNTITKGTRIELLKDVLMGMNLGVTWDPSTFTYEGVCELVKIFNCGAYDDGTNAGTTMTVELCLFNPDNSGDYIVVYTYRYTF